MPTKISKTATETQKLLQRITKRLEITTERQKITQKRDCRLIANKPRTQNYQRGSKNYYNKTQRRPGGANCCPIVEKCMLKFSLGSQNAC